MLLSDCIFRKNHITLDTQTITDIGYHILITHL